MPAVAGVCGSGGMGRPVLYGILSGRVLSCGVRPRFGLSVTEIVQDGAGVDVAFSDGTAGRCALVIGADGIYSRAPRQLFPAAPKPEYTGQSVWRMFVPRPPEVDRRHYFLGGEVKVAAGPRSRRR